MKFTDKYVRSLEPRAERYDDREGSDRPGFGLRVFPSGTKTWFHVFTFRGKKFRMSLGEYPHVTLAKAHELHADAVKKLANGINPAEERQEDRATPDVAKLVNRYVAEWAKPRKRSWETDQRILEKDVVPAWGTLLVHEVTRRHVRQLLSKIMARGAPAMANMTFSVVRRMFSWAVEQDILEHSPAVGVRAPAPLVQKDRVLSPDEIRAFWAALDASLLSTASVGALRLVLTTAQRPGEVLGMTWEEVEGDWWTIPSERVKNKLTHRVPLSALALEIMGPARKAGAVFPSGQGKNRGAALHKDSLSQALRALLLHLDIPAFTPHDLRRTAASLMTGGGIDRLVVSKILNHAEPGVTAVYDRHSYDAEKRRALEQWARQLKAIVEGKAEEKVVDLAARRTGGGGG